MGNSDFTFENKNIVILSPEPWGENLLSKHHFALSLAKLGNRVWFITSLPNQQKLTQIQKHAIPPGITLVAHRYIPGINFLYKPFARLLAKVDVQKLRGKINSQIDIIWSFDPYQMQFLKLFNASVCIYHPVDNHYTPLESRVVAEADIVVSNSDSTLQRLAHKHKHKIGHGIASYFFGPFDKVSLPGGHNKIKVGYVGNLSNRLFDFDLFLKLATDYPNVNFYLIGPRGSSNLSSNESPAFNWQRLDKLSNVFWLGPQPSHALPSYIKQMQILLVLYKPDSKGFTVNPHKILEYLSSGNLVITPTHDENADLNELLLQTGTLQYIPAVFKEAVNNLDKYLSDDLISKRIATSLSMTYENRLKKLEEIIREQI